MNRLAVALLLIAAPARAELARPVRAPMTAASDGVCQLLKADRHDSCRRVAHVDGTAGTAPPFGGADGRAKVPAVAGAGLPGTGSAAGRRHGTIDHADVYRAGSAHGINRVVLAVADGDDVFVGPAIDLPGEDVTLTAVEPNVHAIQLDGRPGVVLDVVSKFRAGKQRWQTETVVGCGTSEAGAWQCATIDAGRCEATIDPDGNVTTSCGGRARLTLEIH